MHRMDWCGLTFCGQKICLFLQVGHVEHQPHRSGVFPVSFVHILSD